MPPCASRPARPSSGRNWRWWFPAGLLGLVECCQLLVVLIKAHAAGAVAVLVGQVQALLVDAISDSVLLILQAALTITQAKPVSGALSLQPQRCDLRPSASV